MAVQRKNNIDLVCSIAELSGLFEKRTSVSGFLQNVVDLVAQHMDSDVCSIYLFDEDSQELILRATRGLVIDESKDVRMRIGEGLSGVALKELRPIRVGHAPSNPFYKSIPHVHEENFSAFLAVPIRRSLKRIGVIVLQHSKPDYFTQHDSKALRAIASQLAATLENAELLMKIHEQGIVQDKRDPGGFSRLKGVPTSEGIAFGSAVVLGHREELFQSIVDKAKARRDTLEDFDRSLQQTLTQLEDLQREVTRALSDVASLIFDSHLLMLQDSEFTGRMRKMIEGGRTASDAIIEVVEQYVSIFSGSSNASVQEKVQDVQDLGYRLLHNLLDDHAESGSYADHVVVASDIYPSELVKLRAQSAEGVLLVSSGITSHVSILARSLGMPLVICKNSDALDIPNGTELILDGFEGNIYLNPTEDIVKKFQRLHYGLLHSEQESRDIPAQTYTIDHQRVIVQANINLINDVTPALQYNSEGVGLYRSEFPFIIRNNFPSEEEQLSIYQRILDPMKDQEVVLRTLDIGGDKQLSYTENAVIDPNPFLGFRGIRFSFGHADIFREQLRAMLRAGYKRKLGILFPMISSLDELLQARSILNDAIDELSEEGIEHNPSPKVGAMIEVPSAVDLISDIAACTDFLSIGTNDLVMYLLAADRTNELVQDLHKSHHPSVLRTLKRIADGVGNRISTVSVCGGAGADPWMIPFFLGIGIRKFSVEPRQIPMVKDLVSKLTIRESRRLVSRLLAMKTIHEVETYLGGNN
ncbi:phosphoenolpyruvate--protein phosphotransferase [Spirochaeta dissipatitropha]